MNLLGQNIGQNYRGIINLGATINSPLSTTLQSVTDGMGNNSPLQLSTAQVVYSGSTLNTLVFGAFNSGKTSGIGFFNANSDATPVWYLGAGNDNRIQLYSNEITLRAGGTNIAKFFPSAVNIGNPDAYSPSARLQVRGDGTNPIGRFESSAGAEAFIFRDTTQLQFGSQGNYISSTANGTSSSAAGRGLLFVGQSGQNIHQFTFSSINQETSGTLGAINISASYIAGAGSALYQPLRIAYTINNSGAQTGTATGIFLNATETALNGMGHNLMDLQVGGVSRFRVSNGGIIVSSSNISTTAGSIYAANGYSIGWSGGSQFSSSTDGIINLLNSGFNNFNRLNFGGTTNAFPAIKRNGAAIDFRLADDSAFCSINTLDINTRIVSGNTSSGLILRPDGGGISGRTASLESFTSGLGWTQSFSAENGKDYGIMSRGAIVGASTLVASAILQADSTTKGFLLPRMTTTQKNAITTPATGLVLYDSTLNKLCVYTGSAWETITSV